MYLGKYHQLVEWTQQQLLGKKAAALSIETQDFLQTLAIESDKWLAQTTFLEKNYSWAVGSFDKLKLVVQKRGLKWTRGMRKVHFSSYRPEICSG